MSQICKGCGQIKGVVSYDQELWHCYHRIPSLVSRSHIEPFVYYQDDLEEMGFYDDEDTHDAVMLSMERNMQERGLCPECGRPDLRGVDTSEMLTEEEARDLHSMYAEMEAERRAGA